MMGKEILIQDEVLAPEGAPKINFEGKNPFVVVTMIPTLLRNVMKITGKDIHELEIRWDATDDPREFYGRWQGTRSEDRWSKTRLRVIVQGAMSLKDRTGWVTIEIKGFLDTSINFNTFLQKGMWWIFFRSFYWKQRRMYLELAKDNLYTMKEAFIRELGAYIDGEEA